jgi:cold shock CspA family protein
MIVLNYGTLRFFNHQRSFGFIQDDAGNDDFVHRSALEASKVNIASLRDDTTRPSYDVETRSNGKAHRRGGRGFVELTRDACCMIVAFTIGIVVGILATIAAALHLAEKAPVEETPQGIAAVSLPLHAHIRQADTMLFRQLERVSPR